jgi:2-polyprenyl-6-methoxyphenol hydroxylase-like FAD-dependent oxidoreductase
MAPVVLIVGAGPTGLTLACELARAGVPFQVVEQSEVPQSGSRGKGIQPRSLEVFDDLGIVDRVLAHGRMAMPMRVTAQDGSVRQSDGGVQVVSPDIPYPMSVITPQWRVEDALRSLLTSLGGTVEFGTVVERVESVGEVVRVDLRHGGASEALHVRWLVGCDGGHSLIRKQAGIAFEGETLEAVRMLVADVSVDGLDRDAWHMWQHASGMVALCPLPSTELFQYQASVPPGGDVDLSIEHMQRVLDARAGRADIRLRSASWSGLRATTAPAGYSSPAMPRTFIHRLAGRA